MVMVLFIGNVYQPRSKPKRTRPTSKHPGICAIHRRLNEYKYSGTHKKKQQHMQIGNIDFQMHVTQDTDMTSLCVICICIFSSRVSQARCMLKPEIRGVLVRHGIRLEFPIRRAHCSVLKSNMDKYWMFVCCCKLIAAYRLTDSIRQYFRYFK